MNLGLIHSQLLSLTQNLSNDGFYFWWCSLYFFPSEHTLYGHTLTHQNTMCICFPSLFWCCSLYFQWRSHSLKSSQGFGGTPGTATSRGFHRVTLRIMRMEAPNHGPLRSQHDQHVRCGRESVSCWKMLEMPQRTAGAATALHLLRMCVCVCVHWLFVNTSAAMLFFRLENWWTTWHIAFNRIFVRT